MTPETIRDTRNIRDYKRLSEINRTTRGYQRLQETILEYKKLLEIIRDN